MKLEIRFLLLFFIFFLSNNTQIKCTNNNSKKNKDTLDNKNIINLIPGKIQTNFITFDNPKYLIYNNTNLLNYLIIHLFSINCQIKVDIENNIGNVTIINPSENDTYLIKAKNRINITLSLNKKEEINFSKCIFVINSMLDNNFELKV